MLNVLTKIGLSAKEAKVYLAALELGKASIQDIAKKAGINRTTTYVMITELEKRGLVNPLKVGKRNYFAAQSPDTILDILKKEKQEIENKEREIKEILPELKSVYNVAPGKPKIQFYEGEAMFEKIAEDILGSGAKEILEIYNADLLPKTFSILEKTGFDKKRKELGIKSKSIYTRSAGRFKNPLELTEELFIEQEKFPFWSNIFIYANRIGIASLKGDMMGVIIESEEISETMKSLFKLAWEGKKKEMVQEENGDEEELEEGG